MWYVYIVWLVQPPQCSTVIQCLTVHDVILPTQQHVLNAAVMIVQSMHLVKTHTSSYVSKRQNILGQMNSKHLVKRINFEK